MLKIKRNLTLLLSSLFMMMITAPIISADTEMRTELAYVALDCSYVESPGVQTIVVGIDKMEANIDSATLFLEKEGTEGTIEVDASRFDEESIVFTINYSEDNQSGVYTISSIAYSRNGENTTYILSDLGMDIRYGVNTQIQTEPDEIGIEVFDDKNIVMVDGKEEEVSKYALTESISQVVPKNINPKSESRAKKNLVVVLDPGHDNIHAGARANGLQEEMINLKIVQACRDELSKYAGVTVYTTRSDSGDCPYPGNAKGICNLNRVKFAESVNADIFISFHINSSESSQPKGVEIYYPNKNYRPDLSEESKKLAQKVLDKLVSLGLKEREIKVWNSANGSTYPDGSLADYLTITSECKLRGIPSILIEHAFISNKEDAAFLSREENLKMLGRMDAEAIKEAYSLDKNKLEVLGINYQLQDKYIEIGVDYKSISDIVEFKWQAYNIAENAWYTISDWSNTEKTQWKPKLADYWLYVQLRDKEGNAVEQTIAFRPDKDYTLEQPGASEMYDKVREHVLGLRKKVRQKLHF